MRRTGREAHKPIGRYVQRIRERLQSAKKGNQMSTKDTDTFTVEDALCSGPGLDGYAYQAAVYCEVCAEEIIRRVFAEHGGRMDGLDFQDSEELPQPIFFGESDCAEHCDDCGEYLYGPQEEDYDY